MLHSRKIRKTKNSNMRKEGHCEAAVFLFCVLVQNGRVSLVKRGNLAYPAGAQEGRHLRFPPSCESPLSLGESGADCRHVTASKWGNGRGFFLCCGRTTFGVRPLEQPVRSVRYRSATHVISSKQARHDSAAQRFYLCRLSKSCGCSQFAPENGLRGTVILQSTLSCPSGNSPCAAPCVE